jgi:hypothetical protein
MRPERESCLVEVLDRLLNKGAILNADLIITVAGVPLIGVNLRAILASMETMLDYGLMEAWDRETRDWYASQRRGLSLEDGEAVLFKIFGYLWQGRSWIPGLWHVTDRRLLLWRREPAEVIFQVPLTEVLSLMAARERTIFELRHSGGHARLSISESQEFSLALERAAARRLLEESEGLALSRG